MPQNLLVNPDLSQPGLDGVPAGWYLWAPRDNLKPRLAPHQHGAALVGNGAVSAFGKLGQEVAVTPGQWYEVCFRFRSEGIDDLSRCALLNLTWRKDGTLLEEKLLDRITREGDWLVARGVHRCPPEANTADIEVFFRHSPAGRLVVAEARLSEAEPRSAPRRARVAAVKCCPGSPSTPERNRDLMCAMLDRAGQAQADICCLPEACNRIGTSGVAQDVAEPLEGPSFAAYAERARAHGMWTVACYYTMEDGVCYNTAALIDREGKLAGAYRKTHLHWPEYRDGVTPGDEYPVFETDFGTIGIMICYDSWFPEVARLLAYKGAEAIFFPVWGYDQIILRGRAVDNNTFIIAGCVGGPASVIHSNGDLIAQTHSEGVVVADIAIEERPTFAYVDREITNGIPGATRWTRDTVSMREYDELREQILRV